MLDANTNKVTGYVMPVGNGAVGKTSLALTLERDTLPADWENTIRQVRKSQNLEFRYLCDQIEVNGQVYRVLQQYLVPPGQKEVELAERSRTFEDVIQIYQSIIRRVDVVLVSYKITDIDTYHDVEYWLEKVNHIAHDKTSFIIVGTHLDLHMQREVNDRMIKTGRDYVSTLMKNFKPSWKGYVTSIEVSNINGENILQLRKLISGSIILAAGIPVAG
jgi:GTPase SAR1 family protein